MNKQIEKLLENVRVNQQIERLAEQAGCTIDRLGYGEGNLEKFAELILANADELKREVSTDPINKPFELNPKFVAKCDEIGRSRRQFQ